MTDAGTVCFCFTDIEGSTRLLRHLGETAYDGLIERHRSLLRAALSETDGREVRAEGDGFFLAFDSSADALLFAATAQQLLAAEVWPAGAEVRVRMGLHSGVAEQRPDGDYMALAVHQAARVSAAAHGGQVLLTQTVARNVALPGGTELIGVGRYRLRDFESAVELLQLTRAGDQSRFPPVRAAREQIGLPVPRTSTVGRDRELEHLSELLPSYPMVTLVGPGGIGKTRLAVEAALAAAAHFPDGVHLIELSNLPDPDLVPGSVVAAVGLRPAPGQVPIDALLALLVTERRLLVLDSCERCIDAVVSLADSLMAACPGVAIVATTTEALRVPGERVVPVGPLQVPGDSASAEVMLASGGVRLLVERASAAGADVGEVSDSTEAAKLGTIARRLDGIPLALELAAGRIAELGLDAVEAGLDDRFSLLTNGYRTALGRHQTLEAAVAWTVDLLDDRQRDALERLSVLAGRWPAADVAAVAGLGSGGVALVDELIERALVVIDGDVPRVRMLDTIRAYAASHRPSAMVPAIEQARDNAILERIMDVREGSEDEIVDEFEALLPDILAATEPNRPGGDPRVATRIQTAAGSYFELRGLWAEGRQRLHSIIATCPPGPERMLAIANLANLEQLLGNQAVASQLSRQVLEDPEAPAHARCIGLMVAFPPGTSSPDADDPFEQAIVLAEGLSSLVMAAGARWALSRLAVGDPAGAVERLEELIIEAERRGRWSIAAQSRGSLGGALAMLGQDERAEAELRKAEELAESRGALGVAGAAMSNRALLAFRQGRLDDALELAERRIQLARKMGDIRGEAPALNVISNLAMARGDLALAREAGVRTHELYQHMGQPDGVGVACFNLVALAEREHDHKDAARWIEASMSPARAGSPVAVALSLFAAGAVGCIVGDDAGPALLAAADAHSPVNLPLDPGDRTWLADAEAAAVGSLGAEVVDEQRAVGAALSIPEALAMVRQVAARCSSD